MSEYGGYFEVEMGDYERYVLGADRELDPDAWAERMTDAADLRRKQDKEDRCDQPDGQA